MSSIPAKKCKPVDMTEQSHKDACDIRLIMDRAQRTGMLTHRVATEGQYQNLASRPQFDEAMRIIAHANTVFETIPAKIREQFNHDPAKFLEYIENPENRANMKEMGFDTSHLPPEEPEKVSKPKKQPEKPPEAPQASTTDD